MIRKAVEQDLSQISDIYEAIHTEEECGRMSIGWARGVYPTRRTAEDAWKKGELFVMEVDGKITAAAKINQEEVPEYRDASWQFPARPEEILVLHTLVVDPKEQGNGYAAAFVHFYEEYARKLHCPYLRMDTNRKNQKARRLYSRLGYQEVGIVSCVFNGIADVQLVCLEKKI